MATVFWIVVFIINEFEFHDKHLDYSKINAAEPIFRFQFYLILYMWMISLNVYVIIYKKSYGLNSM